ncbi:MAG TPA: glycosyl hydrolase family 2 [Terriglobia bacterium]|nr:glycosyl hydrolase family 2 [Terriglobia bacterium]
MKTVIRIYTKDISFLVCFLISGMVLAEPGVATSAAPIPAPLPLRDAWTLQSSRKVSEGGEIIASKTFQPHGWYRTAVPSTVVAAQVAAGELPDPYFGMNLRNFPGMTYRIGAVFNHLPMDKDSPYACSWWYRTEFKVPREYEGRTIWMHFQGINYRANVWLNGGKIADASDIAGAYRILELNVTRLLLPGQDNVLALEVFAPTENDLAINWVDWNPTPPDKNMGIWRGVYLDTTGPVSIRFPQVVTHFPDTSLQQADLTVMAQLHNATDKPVAGELEALVDNVHLRQNLSLQPHETRSVQFAPQQFPELRVKQPKLWWPREVGTPNLLNLAVRFSTEGKLSDAQQVRFGIREVTSELTERGHRLFRINGRKILIRGAAYAHDMLLRHPSPDTLEAHFQYVQEMNLNTIRLEAQLGNDEFFDQADEKGILIMAGWCCCDIWERWKKWKPVTLEVARESLRSQALRLRRHPSMLVWLNGSDGPPPEDVERAYLQVLKETDWPNPSVSSAAGDSTTVTGPSGVKMPGPYDYEPPSYWLVDNKKYGGAFGYNTETSPGPAIPPLQSLNKMLPKEHLWPIDEVWDYHNAGERFKNLNRYNQAMDATYGPASRLEDYLRKSQAMAYDGQRAMFEAYGRNKYISTGVIQWMLNNAWPSLYWHLYDYYLYPAGGYFGTKKACEPLHVQYSYDDRSVVVVNSRQEPFSGLALTARLTDFNLKEIFSKEVKTDVEPDSSKQILALPAFAPEPAKAVYFLKLSLRNKSGKEVSSNFYWLPAQLSTLAWDKTPDTAFTPIAIFEDLTELNRLPQVRMQAKAKVEKNPDADLVRISLHNPSLNLAFQVHLGIRQGDSEEEILPVLWEDNYLALMPGESKEITARYLKPGALGKRATLRVDGWNVEPATVSLSAEPKDKK